MNTGREGLAFRELVGHDNVHLHLDTYHMNIEESGMLEPILDLGDTLRYVHIGESHRGYLGLWIGRLRRAIRRRHLRPQLRIAESSSRCSASRWSSRS